MSNTWCLAQFGVGHSVTTVPTPLTLDPNFPTRPCNRPCDQVCSDSPPLSGASYPEKPLKRGRINAVIENLRTIIHEILLC